MVYDPELFRRDVWPKLAGVPLKAIVEAIGCSNASASDIRRGKRMPHVRRGRRWENWPGSTTQAPPRGGV